MREFQNMDQTQKKLELYKLLKKYPMFVIPDPEIETFDPIP